MKENNNECIYINRRPCSAHDGRDMRSNRAAEMALRTR